MSIPSVKSAADAVSPATAVRPAATGPDFAALAASLARGDLAGARAAITTGNEAHGDDLSACVVAGNLAAARVMLGTLGMASHDPGVAKAAQSDRPAAKVADDHAANSVAANAIPDETFQGPKAEAPRVVDASIQDVGRVAAAAPDADLAAVLRALATGNAGSIPADVINRYGPGGELYDPAAIMDAYRSSSLGQSQMAATAWIGKPV